MRRFKHFSLWFIFLSTFGFAGGGYFLLFLIVPFEEWLVGLGSDQDQIDAILKYFVYGWVIFGFIVSFLYYRFILHKKKMKLAYLFVAFTIINASFVFYLFMNTNSAIVAMSRGEVEQTTEQLTFGPYPDEQALIDLKKQGYDGVITLLSPTIIFEKELLEDEIEYGEEVGLNIHSFPMLPWVGDNTKSIDGIVELLKENPNKRYYVHCYLGKHRVDLIKQTILKKLGETNASDEDKERIFLQSKFERGNVYTFKNESIILGPFPTDEEWFKLLRLNVEELITFLDEDSKFYKQEKKIAEEQGMKVTRFDLDADLPDPDQLKEIRDYIKNNKRKVYVHDFSKGKKIDHVELMLRKELAPIQKRKLPQNFNKGNIKILDNWLVIGPEPTNTEIDMLKDADIQTMIYTGEVSKKTNEVMDQVLSQDIRMEIIPHKESYTTQDLYQLAERIDKGTSQTYLFGLIESEQQILFSMLQGMSKGVNNRSLQDRNVARGSFTVKSRKLMIGPELNEDEWEEHILKNGFSQIVLLQASSVQTDDLLETQHELAKKSHIPFVNVQMDEDYLEDLLNVISPTEKTTYLIVPDQLKELVMKDLKSLR
ncbi:hypothetical protein [Pseudalkalibacillus berkeleyi]|uniref:Uncharacterized protein n=1 Tax=Pseudalkalibacillus berkeleyi TaxID=1069813 RepID=A0ABS9GYU2_9BACL|nr:hypothetical protein [Pseudalkalibacillus berkeleyi]MCF6136931.1 hypothetical protein [Pseudalkalibacillus berkeleyi]